MSNILQNKKVRSKRKKWWSGRPYYEMEDVSFKEKVYTFHYNMETTGLTTLGESQWCKRMMEMDISRWSKNHDMFKEDFIKYSMS